jgi:tripartite-type tricarboxylate transporter receptor subunit TctC
MGGFNMRNFISGAFRAVLLTCMLGLPVQAQTYPSRIITFVVAYTPGGTGDLVARLIASKLGPALGQTVIVENRAGASGSIGSQYVSRAAADGYTVLVGQTSEIAINPSLHKNLSYNPEVDLLPVALAADAPLALVVPANAPYSTLDGLLKAGETTANGLTFASAGVGTPGHIAGEFLRVKTKAKLLHVPYKGDALKDVVAGHVDLFFSGYPAAIPLVSAGNIKILAVSSGERVANIPNVPTVSEVTGIKEFNLTVWQGFFVPRGTPKDVVDKLNAAINETLVLPEVKQKLSEAGAYVRPMSADKFAEFVETQRQKYKLIFKETGIVAE